MFDLETPPANSKTPDGGLQWGAKVLADLLDARLLKGKERSRERLPILDFGLQYFPHRCEIAPSRLHRELCADLERILASPESEREAIAAPRGNAKTTWLSLIFPIYCIVYELKHFMAVITNESTYAVELVEDIAHELEENEHLARDFPHAVGIGPVWKKGVGVLVTPGDVKVQGFGSGKKIRGRKHRQYRVDLVIGDDLEDDEHCRSRDQRNKTCNWWNKAVMKTKGVGKKFDALVAGTILHFDSMLARLCDPRQSPGWRSRRYQAVLKWSENKTLWDRWQAIYTDWRKPDDQRQHEAHRFFLEHQEEMLRGTEVLWPEGEPYYELMKLRIDDGPVSFDSEKQNQPIDPETCFFKEEWFRWFDEEEDVAGTTWLRPEKGEAIRLEDCDCYGSLDPSMGKKDRGSDPSALVSIACYPARRLKQGKYRSYWVIDADIARIHPHDQLELICARHLERGYIRFGIEAIQFQELFADDVREALLKKPQLAGLNIVKLTPHTDKALRIQKLENFIYSGRLKFSRKLSTLYNQFRFFTNTNPPQDHDDGPDATEQCMETIGAIGWKVLSDMSDEADEMEAQEKEKSANQRQLEAALPELAAAKEKPAGAANPTCGNCVHLVERNGLSYCGLRDRMRVRVEMEGCGSWDGGVIRERPKEEEK